MAGDRAQTLPRQPAEIRAEIERAREDIGDTLFNLRREVKDRLDWRWWVRDRPQVALAAAFAIGYLLGRRQGNGGSRGRANR